MFLIYYYILILIPCTYAYPTWFHEYIKTHNKSYVNQEEIYKIMKPKFESIIETKDLGLKLHHFSDKSRPRNIHIKRKKIIDFNHHTKHHLGLPLEFDWNKKGFVTPAIEQGVCGGCFSIAAIGNLEFWYKKKTGKLLPLSIQQGIDCTEGCEGGLMVDVYKYAQKYPIGPAYWNPFRRHNRKCKKGYEKPYIKVKNYIVISDEYNMHVEDKLAHNILSYGPIPVGIDSSSHQFD